MEQKGPRSREKNVTSQVNGVHRRGEGLGSGPVGSGSAFSGKQQSSAGKKAAIGGGVGVPVLIIAFLFLSKFMGGGGSVPSGDIQQGALFNSDSGSGYTASQMTEVDNSVAAGSRSKRTNIIGEGADQVTVMVYMCGTDLESRSGMASSDIQEMAQARFGDNVNLVIYTGGCTNWKLSGISNKVNQIYQIKDGKLLCIESDMGSKAMTDPDNLASFISYCEENYPANRNNLILWDHGGGSVSGYGYDEKNKSSGSMTLAGINTALKKANVKFDFIGFDACLMATAETALMLNEHADYLIASEETEPGIGWYYKNWLTKLGKNSSLPTVEIGKYIIDDFVSTCAQECRGQQTTLSIIDLAEFANTVPSNLNEFAKSVSQLMTDKEYQKVSDARYTTREFAKSTKIDQVDLVDLAEKMNTSAGMDLSEAIKGAVKYNRTSSNMTNAYGVSIYFPYQKVSNVDRACQTYNQIGMDSEYSKCIRQFASLETSGQVAAGGSSSPVSSLLGSGLSLGSSGSSDVISGLLGSFLGGLSDRSIDGLDSSNISFMNENALSEQDTADYLASNSFRPQDLVWDETSGGQYTITLSDDQWSLVHSLDKNMFYDDGAGYIDLGLDNVYSFNDKKQMVADTDLTWLAINGQPVAYYHTDTVEDGDKYTITGYVPAILNDDRVKLIITFDNSNPSGYVSGAVLDYVEDETDTVAKNFVTLNAGDKLDFVCDYYSYDGVYLDSFKIGDQVTVTDSMNVSDVSLGEGNAKIIYRFTDIYNQIYWSESIEK